MSGDVECLVIGAGVVGLAVARALAKAGGRVAVVDQHDRVGAETSSRNSEVIHAGLYYPPGSLKARLCVEGRSSLYRFAQENDVPVRRTGKLVVATSMQEITALDAITANAAASGVDDLGVLTGAEARAREPELSCVKACYSPSTGIIDTHAFMTALEGHLQAYGGEVVLSTRVSGIARRAGGGFTITTGTASRSYGVVTCERLVIAAGLHSSGLAAQLFGDPHARGAAGAGAAAGYAPTITYFAKGHYFTLSGRAPFSHLIYPIPGAGGLGVHLTLDIAGVAKFGPDVEWVDRIDYAFDDADGARRSRFADEIRRWWPNLPEAALQAGYTGIRPKTAPAGAAVADFAIHGREAHGIDDLVVLYGIESPGLTASLAIAEFVAERLR
jgi:L-2-hydroxyglutarate oxidase LhgO